MHKLPLHSVGFLVFCAGAQWVKAQEVFDSMRMRGCTPDVVTYTGGTPLPPLGGSRAPWVMLLLQHTLPLSCGKVMHQCRAWHGYLGR